MVGGSTLAMAFNRYKKYAPNYVNNAKWGDPWIPTTNPGFERTSRQMRVETSAGESNPFLRFLSTWRVKKMFPCLQQARGKVVDSQREMVLSS